VSLGPPVQGALLHHCGSVWGGLQGQETSAQSKLAPAGAALGQDPPKPASALKGRHTAGHVEADNRIEAGWMPRRGDLCRPSRAGLTWGRVTQGGAPPRVGACPGLPSFAPMGLRQHLAKGRPSVAPAFGLRRPEPALSGFGQTELDSPFTICYYAPE